MKSPFMPWYGRDFYGSTFVRLLPRKIRADYLELLWHQWDNGSLPESTDDLMRLLNLSPKEWAASWIRLEDRFPICTAGGRRNERLEEIRSSYEAKRLARSLSGKAGSQRRWQTDGKPIATGIAKTLANAMAKPCLAVAETEESKAVDRSPLTETVHQAPGAPPPTAPIDRPSNSANGQGDPPLSDAVVAELRAVERRARERAGAA